MAAPERFWTRRLRWRLRGAWVWPAFGALTVGDALALTLLPPVRTGVDFVPGLIVSSFANLFLVGAVAPWLAKRIQSRPRAEGEEALPYEVVLDRTATALLVAALAGIVAAGLAARPLVVSETKDTENAANAFLAFVDSQGTEEERVRRDTANTIRLEEDFFRICIARTDPRRASCFFVDTAKKPASVKRDPDARPNQLYRR